MNRSTRRKRLGLVKKLHESGKTKEEIALIANVEPLTVQSWLDKSTVPSLQSYKALESSRGREKIDQPESIEDRKVSIIELIRNGSCDSFRDDEIIDELIKRRHFVKQKNDLINDLKCYYELKEENNLLSYKIYDNVENLDFSNIIKASEIIMSLHDIDHDETGCGICENSAEYSVKIIEICLHIKRILSLVIDSEINKYLMGSCSISYIQSSNTFPHKEARNSQAVQHAILLADTLSQKSLNKNFKPDSTASIRHRFEFY